MIGEFPMDQQIRFCKTAEGVHLAFATVGEGPPMVWPALGKPFGGRMGKPAHSSLFQKIGCPAYGNSV
jgi:hypothetical protein